MLGASPDGKILRPASHNYNYQIAEVSDALKLLDIAPEVLEVKCPFKARDMSIPEAIESIKDFCLGKFSYKFGISYLQFANA